MARSSLYFLAVFEILLAAPASAQNISPFYTTAIDDGLTSISTHIGGNTQLLYSESHALLIGEVNYANWDPLVTVPGELARLAKTLERQHFKVELHFDLPLTRIIHEALEAAVLQRDRRAVFRGVGDAV